MRPSPLVLLGLVALGFGLVAVPLARLTGAEAGLRSGADRPVIELGVAEPSAPGVAAVVRVWWAHPPERVVLSSGGREIGHWTRPWERGAVASVEWRIFPGEVTEILVEAEWPSGTPLTALGVELEPEGLEARQQTGWADGGMLVEAFTFYWP